MDAKFRDNIIQDMKEIEQELRELDDVYNKIKIHFDTITDPKNFSIRGIANINRLAESLTAVKSAKHNLIRDRLSAYKNIEDFDLKWAKVDSDENEGVGIQQMINAVESLKGVVSGVDEPSTKTEDVDKDEINKKTEESLDERLRELGILDDEEESEEPMLETEKSDTLEIEPDLTEFAEEALPESIETIEDIDFNEYEIVVGECGGLRLMSKDTEEIRYECELNIPVKDEIDEDTQALKIISVETGEILLEQ